ncbi:MAG: sugar ABC transporter ATP-binding protein [Lachnospiraceae bacterium]|uniref:sugar ABC transporter ATP-binding protein n=2 Tax=Parablautia intestinalis TaxID=2320100 RepID=UPI00256F30C4|nr:sugar ABC transporter ATP-binding protein [Parablautia intestinalis]MCI8615864.1 sugar ABC transporter ATP-binding protein [Lachnospiraceae bacterium]
MDTVLLKAENIYKTFGATKAVTDFSMEIRAGEVRGLIGENGSGKSTFSSVVAGVYNKDSGTLYVNGEEYIPHSTVEASAHGIALVVQEAGVIAGISGACNIFLNKEKRFEDKFGINYRKMNQAASEALKNVYAEHIDPSVQTAMLNLEDRKLVEIAKAMCDNPRLLIIDETSNALTTRGREILYKVIEDVKGYGGSVMFITHDLDELIQVCDSVTVMRDGRFVATLPKEKMVVKDLRELMVGREISDNYYRSDFEKDYEDEVVLKAEGLVAPEIKDVTFALHKGEILGIGGLSDCGMHDLGKALFGIEKLDSGTVSLADGTQITNPKVAVEKRMGYMSKNRDTEAIILQFPIDDNICLPSLARLVNKGIIKSKDERELAKTWAGKLSIKLRSIHSYCATLSGGNKQKVVLAKWLGNESKIIIMDCPTRGIDIGVKEAIYNLMQELKKKGVSIIMISEELAELIGMSDRIMVMKDYSVSKILDRSPQLDEKTIIEYMI